MSTGKIVALIGGTLAAVIALALLVAGGGLLLAQTQRDAEGFYVSPAYTVSTSGFAITSDRIDLGANPGDWVPGPGDVTVRVTAQPTGPDAAPVFVGIADADALDRYLAGVEHAQVTQLGGSAGDVTMRALTGDGAPGVPGEQDFWASSAEGSGVQSVTWDARPGTWALAVMHADGSPGVAADVSAGVALTLLPVGVGLFVGGLLMVAVAAALLIAAAQAGSGRVPDSTPSPADRAYPLALVARLDEEPSRWLWLVKWLLAIPHAIVVAVLWLAFVVLTLVAGVAILLTGRYPRGLFDIDVGILRWTWRVTYYAFGVLGTDRYPPFTLDSVEDYPADLDVAYPERLSRGLVLVKWWLLAIPHYLVVAIFTGGALSWTVDVGDPGGGQAVASGGLIGVLVLIAGVVLLVRGRYPRGLYDLLLGLHRWVYRVTAYAALMTDVYPPFRLDTGGAEPGGRPAEPPAGLPPTRQPART